MSAKEPLVRVEELRVHFPRRKSFLGKTLEPFRAVDGVSFAIERGTTVGLVGESGSGKTTTGRALLKLAPVSGGGIFYDGVEVGALSSAAFFPWRKRIQMIFQDPYNSLNPRLTIGRILGEPLEIHFPQMTAAEREGRCADLLCRVGLSPDHLRRYPHEFSGGQRQRIGIARAIAVEPEVIVCDEPVSALDVSVQAQIVNLLADLQAELGFSYLFIAHDLAVVEHLSDWVLVMERGKIVEQSTPEELYSDPKHPYTRQLLAAVPVF